MVIPFESGVHERPSRGGRPRYHPAGPRSDAGNAQAGPDSTRRLERDDTLRVLESLSRPFIRPGGEVSGAARI